MVGSSRAVGSSRKDEQSSASLAPTNDVHLIGRVSGDVTTRVLPSGDEFALWRLVVERPVAAPAHVGGAKRQAPTVDTIDCVTRKPGVRKSALGWAAGDVVDVRGALRRRFWRGAQGPASRYEVEVTQARRARAGTSKR